MPAEPSEAVSLGFGSEIILPTTRDVHQFVTQTLGDLDGVQGWTASMELVTFKRGFVETRGGGGCWWTDVRRGCAR